MSKEPVLIESPILTNACRVVLTRSNPLQDIEASLRLLFRLSLDERQHCHPATNFLLSRVSWFEYPYCRLHHLLLKIARWHRGRCPETATVCYNLIAEGMQSLEWERAADCLIQLSELQRDHTLLLASLRQSYPHKNREVEVHQRYIRALLTIIEKQPGLSASILELIFERLASLDNETHCSDAQQSQPYPDDEALIEARQATHGTCLKLDSLLNIVLDFMVKHENDKLLVKDLLNIYDRQLLITDRLKCVQFLVYFLCERNRQYSCQFLERMVGNVVEGTKSKYSYISNIFYLAGYLVHSGQITNNMVAKCLPLLIEYLSDDLNKRNDLKEDIAQVNLKQLFQQNQALLHVIQLLLYVCTHRPTVYNKIEEELDSLLQLADRKCLFSLFMHPRIWERFCHLSPKMSFTQHFPHQNYHLKFQGKFNVIPLKQLGSRIDQIYRFSDLPPLEIRKRKASHVLEDRPAKRVKLLDKTSQVSEESTTFYRGGEITPHRQI